jgi:hypothetical protein
VTDDAHVLLRLIDEAGTIRYRTFPEISGEVVATITKRGLEEGLVSTLLSKRLSSGTRSAS